MHSIVPKITFWMVLVKMTLEEREDQEQEVPKCVLSAPQMTEGKESKLGGF